MSHIIEEGNVAARLTGKLAVKAKHSDKEQAEKNPDPRAKLQTKRAVQKVSFIAEEESEMPSQSVPNQFQEHTSEIPQPDARIDDLLNLMTGLKTHLEKIENQMVEKEYFEQKFSELKTLIEENTKDIPKHSSDKEAEEGKKSSQQPEEVRNEDTNIIQNVLGDLDIVLSDEEQDVQITFDEKETTGDKEEAIPKENPVIPRKSLRKKSSKEIPQKLKRKYKKRASKKQKDQEPEQQLP